MIIEKLIDLIKSAVLRILEALPTVEPLELPSGIDDGINTIFGFLGWLMPYSMYSPLITFVFALTAFRIGYNIFLKLKK